MTAGLPVKWGWKDPRTTLFCREWLTIFPEARVLHVVRHPLDAAMSLKDRELRGRCDGTTPIAELGELQRCVEIVAEYVRCAAEMEQLGPRYKEVRFEDVQSSPRKHLADIAAFCGLDPSEAQIEAAASTIDGGRRNRWAGLSPEIRAGLLADYEFKARYDYT
jgi:hypothetical protein